MAALRAHRKLLPDAYGQAGLSAREEDAMQAALDAVVEHDDAEFAALAGRLTKAEAERDAALDVIHALRVERDGE